ncbi:hypothetical protein UNDKW_0071 [Undibacterium sp. KW1]|uniref:hypothetical protein n=1 Tax=Undibacterium sp. KW1 TaxID=2058624 RepID=UPI001331D541|nr:hypothetical protein [Undibacterium sp. KW1]BBB58344.1 hypothetical protein UNDKW_0071 [Undibacterium sp. KW1]
MAKKFIPIPEIISEDLRVRVVALYGELIDKLPKSDFNPSYHIEASKEGFNAEVKFYSGDGRYSSSLWQHTARKGWYMRLDWND